MRVRSEICPHNRPKTLPNSQGRYSQCKGPEKMVLCSATRISQQTSHIYLPHKSVVEPETGTDQPMIFCLACPFHWLLRSKNSDWSRIS